MCAPASTPRNFLSYRIRYGQRNERDASSFDFFIRFFRGDRSGVACRLLFGEIERVQRASIQVVVVGMDGRLGSFDERARLEKELGAQPTLRQQLIGAELRIQRCHRRVVVFVGVG